MKNTLTPRSVAAFINIWVCACLFFVATVRDAFGATNDIRFNLGAFGATSVSRKLVRIKPADASFPRVEGVTVIGRDYGYRLTDTSGVFTQAMVTGDYEIQFTNVFIASTFRISTPETNCNCVIDASTLTSAGTNSPSNLSAYTIAAANSMFAKRTNALQIILTNGVAMHTNRGITNIDFIGATGMVVGATARIGGFGGSSGSGSINGSTNLGTGVGLGRGTNGGNIELKSLAVVGNSLSIATNETNATITSTAPSATEFATGSNHITTNLQGTVIATNNALLVTATNIANAAATASGRTNQPAHIVLTNIANSILAVFDPSKFFAVFVGDSITAAQGLPSYPYVLSNLPPYTNIARFTNQAVAGQNWGSQSNVYFSNTLALLPALATNGTNVWLWLWFGANENLGNGGGFALINSYSNFLTHTTSRRYKVGILGPLPRATYIDANNSEGEMAFVCNWLSGNTNVDAYIDAWALFGDITDRTLYTDYDTDQVHLTNSPHRMIAQKVDERMRLGGGRDGPVGFTARRTGQWWVWFNGSNIVARLRTNNAFRSMGFGRWENQQAGTLSTGPSLGITVHAISYNQGPAIGFQAASNALASSLQMASYDTNGDWTGFGVYRDGNVISGAITSGVSRVNNAFRAGSALIDNGLTMTAGYFDASASAGYLLSLNVNSGLSGQQLIVRSGSTGASAAKFYGGSEVSGDTADGEIRLGSDSVRYGRLSYDYGEAILKLSGGLLDDYSTMQLSARRDRTNVVISGSGKVGIQSIPSGFAPTNHLDVNGHTSLRSNVFVGNLSSIGGGNATAPGGATYVTNSTGIDANTGGGGGSTNQFYYAPFLAPTSVDGITNDFVFNPLTAPVVWINTAGSNLFFSNILSGVTQSNGNVFVTASNGSGILGSTLRIASTWRWIGVPVSVLNTSCWYKFQIEGFGVGNVATIRHLDNSDGTVEAVRITGGAGSSAITMSGSTSGSQIHTVPAVTPPFTNVWSAFAVSHGQALTWDTNCLCWTNMVAIQITNDFVMNAYNTNLSLGRVAFIYATIAMTNILAGDVSRVGLWLDQDGDGVWEKTGIEARINGVALSAGAEELSAAIMPSGRWIFTNLSAGITPSAIIQANSSQVVRP